MRQASIVFIAAALCMGFIQGAVVSHAAAQPAARVYPDLAKLSEAPGSAAGNLESIRTAVSRINRAKTGRLVFPKGVYEVGDAKTIADMDTFMSGNMRQFGDFNFACRFEGVTDLVVDGSGCTLVFDGLIGPFEFTGCRNVTIENLTVDWKRPLFSEGIVTLVLGEMVEVKIFPEYPVHGGEPAISFQTVSLDTGHLSGVVQFSGVTNLKLVAPQTVRMTAVNGKFIKPGDYMNIRHTYVYRHGINFIRCKNATVQDVTLHALPGVGVFGEQTKDITLRRLSILPSGTRSMSINVDGSHFVNCSGTLEVDHCYYQGMGDDAFNMHGRYIFIGDVIDNKTIRATKQTDETLPDVGDAVEFVRPKSLYSYAEAVIAGVQFDREKGESVITFDRTLPADFDKADAIADITKHAKLRFHDTTVRDIRGRALLVQTRDVIIENNHFEHLTGQGVHVDTAYPTWNESVGTRNVIIRNNSFIDCGFGFTGYCEGIAVVVQTECPEPKVGVHRNLTIENNFILGNEKPAFYLSCLDGAVIRGNRVISNGPKARLDYATNVDFENNNFERSDVIVGIGCENGGVRRFSNK